MWIIHIDSYGETYRACRGADRDPYVRISDICEAMGLALAAQLRRIRNTYAVSHKLTYIEVETRHSERNSPCVSTNLAGTRPFPVSAFDVSIEYTGSHTCDCTQVNRRRF